MFDHFVELALREMNKLGVYVYMFFILIWRIVALYKIVQLKPKKTSRTKILAGFNYCKSKKLDISKIIFLRSGSSKFHRKIAGTFRYAKTSDNHFLIIAFAFLFKH